MNEILRTVALTKTYESNGAEVAALRGVDFAVESGEFVAIMGPSGCGKSTLLHLLGGLDRPNSGEIYLAGRRVDTLGEAARAKIRRRQIGYMFQSFNLITNMSAAENIELPALMAGASAAEARRRRVELMGLLGITEQSELPPGRLSGGQQQRVALARALVNEPDLLLADEPTGNLDSRSTREVLGVLQYCNQRGQAVVLVTHDPSVASAANRVVRMRDGEIIGESKIDGLEAAPEVLRSLVEMGAQQ